VTASHRARAPSRSSGEPFCGRAGRRPLQRPVRRKRRRARPRDAVSGARFPPLVARSNAATLEAVTGLCDLADSSALWAASLRGESARRGGRLRRTTHVRPQARAGENTRLGFRLGSAGAHRGLRAAKARNRFGKSAAATAHMRLAHPPVQEGLPRYQGGAPGVSGEGGQHGAGGRGATGRGPFNPGPYVEGGRLSPLARSLLRPIFDRFGYDVARTQIRFDSSVSTANANGDVIRINPEYWASRRPLQQTQLLTHEITHSVQFQRLGARSLRFRLGVERITHPFSNYDVSNELADIPLSRINPVDSRFTLESIASRLEDFARTVPP
jgi:hypothetical protein